MVWIHDRRLKKIREAIDIMTGVLGDWWSRYSEATGCWTGVIVTSIKNGNFKSPPCSVIFGDETVETGLTANSVLV